MDSEEHRELMKFKKLISRHAINEGYTATEIAGVGLFKASYTQNKNP